MARARCWGVTYGPEQCQNPRYTEALQTDTWRENEDIVAQSLVAEVTSSTSTRVVACRWTRRQSPAARRRQRWSIDIRHNAANSVLSPLSACQISHCPWYSYPNARGADKRMMTSWLRLRAVTSAETWVLKQPPSPKWSVKMHVITQNLVNDYRGAYSTFRNNHICLNFLDFV